MIKKIWLPLMILTCSQISFGVDKSSGCGLGWYVLKENTMVSSVLRVTTNGLFFNNTFGMTFGTSNCAKHDFIQKSKQDIHFVESNYRQLELEAATGQGAYLEAFAATMGCAPSIQPAFNAILQDHYQEIFAPSSDSHQEALPTLERIRHLIYEHPTGRMGCAPLS